MFRDAGKAWPQHRDEVMQRLAASPRDAVLFALQSLKDVAYAWELAHSLSLQDDRTWSDLVKAYEEIDPHAVLPVLNRLVLNELVETGAQHYQIAARRLKKMRKLAAGSEYAAEVDWLIAELREIKPPPASTSARVRPCGPALTAHRPVRRTHLLRERRRPGRSRAIRVFDVSSGGRI